MSDVISAIQTAIDTVKKLRELSKKIEDAEIRMLLADLSNELADAKMEVASLKTSLAEESDKVRALSAQLAEKPRSRPRLREGAYEFEGEEGLFCTGCFDSKDKRIRLKDVPQGFQEFGKLQCPICGGMYGSGGL